MPLFVLDAMTGTGWNQESEAATICWSTTTQGQEADIRVLAIAAATILVPLPLDELWWRVLGVIREWVRVRTADRSPASPGAPVVRAL